MKLLLRRPHWGGLALGLLCWWLSLTPSLLPRAWTVQAAISALCFLAGYGVGTLLGWIGHRVLRRTGHQPGPRARRAAWIALGVAAALVVLVGLVSWPGWQNDQRTLVGLGPMSSWVVVPMLPLTVVLIAVLGMIGRLIWVLVRAVDGFFARRFSRPVAILATAVIVVLAVRIVGTDLIWHGLVDWANDRFAAVDTTTADGIEQPTTDTVSGGPGSLVSWDDLGMEGRTFVASATPAAELAAAPGARSDVSAPVRVYVGMQTTDDPVAQSALAVRELERTGGFDREVLVVATTTGTGWVDPDAAAAIEHLYGGDTAIAAIQYSYLPSWIAFLVDPHAAAPAGSALFNAIYDEVVAMPAADRPMLLVFGESLGSYGAEAAFGGFDAATSIANMVARTDGVLFTGPTDSNMIWSKITAERAEASPVWRPVIDDGASLRVFNNKDELVELDADWTAPRIVYVHHPSDPVGSWNWETLWSRPDWTRDPIGYDVPQSVRWYPFITWTQEVFDLMAGFSAEPDYGHDYSVDFVGAWANIARPDGWTSEDTVALQEYLAELDKASAGSSGG